MLSRFVALSVSLTVTIADVSGGPPAPNGGRCAQRKPSRRRYKTDDARRTVIGCHECEWGDNWNQEDGWRHYNYSLLSQLNFHSAAGLLPNGSLLQAGINSAPPRSQCDISDTNATSAFAQIREKCKAAGVRLVLSVAQPATTGVEMLAFLDDDEATTLAIKEMTAMVAARQVGGLCLDWEGAYEFDMNATTVCHSRRFVSSAPSSSLLVFFSNLCARTEAGELLLDAAHGDAGGGS